jgi:hypothetical protein
MAERWTVAASRSHVNYLIFVKLVILIEWTLFNRTYRLNNDALPANVIGDPANSIQVAQILSNKMINTCINNINIILVELIWFFKAFGAQNDVWAENNYL